LPPTTAAGTAASASARSGGDVDVDIFRTAGFARACERAQLPLFSLSDAGSAWERGFLESIAGLITPGAAHPAKRHLWAALRVAIGHKPALGVPPRQLHKNVQALLLPAPVQRRHPQKVPPVLAQPKVAGAQAVRHNVRAVVLLWLRFLWMLTTLASKSTAGFC
jgi:hypothetical protein